MHVLHVLVWLVGQLVEGDPVAWTALVLTAAAVGIAFLRDWRRNNKRRGP
jgi:hypothetical protein